jgi:segregation and condensation protein B
VQKLVVGKPVRLTRAQLETLAIIAYRQPITRPEIDDIRGVDSGGTLRLLLERDLIRVLGKKEEPGRPLLYGTTPDFLEFFNLNDLRDLPTLTEYSELSPESLEEVERLAPEEEEEAATESESATASESESESESEAESESETGSETASEAAAAPPPARNTAPEPEIEESL